MFLAIDIGNTNTVFALCKGDNIQYVWRCETNPRRTGDEYAAFLRPMLVEKGSGFKDIKNVIVCSVVPDADFNINHFCKNHLGRAVKFITAANAGIEAKIDNPAEAGADRLVNAVAVKAHYKAPAIVIDFGTATTFDVIDSKGRYCGGAIAPGINLSIEALQRAAARLPKISIQNPGKAIGTTTKGAMQSGLYWGYIGLIEGLVKKIAGEMGGQKPYVIATGGLAPLFADNTKAIDIVDDDLTIKGLIKIQKDKK